MDKFSCPLAPVISRTVTSFRLPLSRGLQPVTFSVHLQELRSVSQSVKQGHRQPFRPEDLAAFQVTITGRFWVTAEVQGAGPLDGADGWSREVTAVRGHASRLGLPFRWRRSLAARHSMQDESRASG